MFFFGLDSISKGFYSEGGLNPLHYGFSRWFHNGILDSYKNAGYLGLSTAIFFVVFLFLKQILNFKYKEGWIFLILGLLIYCTSVIYEGYYMEMFSLILILSLLFRERRKNIV